MNRRVRFKDIAGVEISTLNPFNSAVEGAVMLDFDKTLVIVGDQQERYLQKLKPMSDAAQLDWYFTDLAHNVERRVKIKRETGLDIGGVEALFAMVAAAMGSAFTGDPDTLLAQSLLYQQMATEIERCVPFKGMVETLLIVRRRWPRVKLIGCTLCPRRLAELRLQRAGGLLELLDGYVAIAHQLPEAPGHPFPEAVQAAHLWVEQSAQLTASQCARHMLRIGMPADCAKPDPTTLYALSNWLGIPTSKILMVDDNPLTGLQMAHDAGAVGVHAAYGCSSEANSEWPQFNYSLESPHGLLAVMEEQFGQGNCLN